MEVTAAHIAEIIISALIFLYVWVVSKQVFQPYFEALIKREESTAGAEDEAKELTEKAQQLQVEYNEKLQAERINALSLRDEIVGSSREEARKFIGEAEAKAKATLEAGRSEIDQAARKALEDIEEQSSVVAKQIVDKVLTVDQSRTIH